MLKLYPNRIFKYGIFCLWLLAFQVVEGQKILYSEGYIVRYQGDTIHGKLRYSTPALRSAKVIFKAHDSDERIKFLPFQIKGYYVEGQYYESRIYDIHPSLSYGLGVFMRRINADNGDVKLYEYWNTDRERGFTQIFLHREGEPLLEIHPFRFRKQVAGFLRDFTELSEEILSGRYNKRHLKSIVDKYNTWKTNYH